MSSIRLECQKNGRKKGEARCKSTLKVAPKTGLLIQIVTAEGKTRDKTNASVFKIGDQVENKDLYNVENWTIQGEPQNFDHLDCQAPKTGKHNAIKRKLVSNPEIVDRVLKDNDINTRIVIRNF